ncbi:MAG: MBL fold metallo-hydrolase [Clostridiales bacterium]|nr:MBL fold metallo-hydrolase [Clostridiales bacterium]
MNNDIRVVHLYHSGVMVETKNSQLYFDVISDQRSFVDVNKKQFYFVSHAHNDHYDPKVFQVSNHNTFLIFSEDIDDHPIGHIITRVEPNKNYEIDNISIKTFDSTDSGVAFLVAIDGMNIFHSGDLNWWHWENRPVLEQRNEEMAYKAIISNLDGEKIDIAFVPIDPRLKSAASLAVRHFIEKVDVKTVFPIHFGESFKILNEILANEIKDERVKPVTKRNESFVV